MGKALLCAVSLLTAAASGVAQAAPSMQGVRQELVSYEDVTGQFGMSAAVSVPALVPQAMGAPVPDIDFVSHRHRDRDRRGHRTCTWRSDRYSREHHAEAAQYRHEHELRHQGYRVIGSSVVSFGRYWFVDVYYRCR